MQTKIYNQIPAEAKSIREDVFIHEQHFSYDYDENDDIAVHLLIYDSDIPIGTCRIFESETKDVYILGRLAVKKEYRAKGVGSMLIQSAKEYVSGLGAKSLILHSQLQARGFYSKLGFSECSAVEYEDGCPHIWMKAEL